MTLPGAPVIWTLLPARIIGLKVEELVNPKVVVPAKVTVVPVLILERSIELFGGA
jgi:hypothetical protein